MISPPLFRFVIVPVPVFCTVARPGLPVPATPGAIVPLLVSVTIVPAFDRAVTAPPPIAPRLSIDEIDAPSSLTSAPILPVAELRTPAPLAPGSAPLPPGPPEIVPLLVRLVMVPAFDIPTPASGLPRPGPPPAILPWLVRLMIVPAFDIAAPPGVPKAPPLPPSIVALCMLFRVSIV